MRPPDEPSGPPPLSLDERFHTSREALTSRGQAHVLAWWKSLDTDARCHLLSQIESIAWDVVEPLIQSHVLNQPVEGIPENLEPPRVYQRTPSQDAEDKYESATSAGKSLIGAGKVAAFTVAGGQGTRLGVDGPK